jgi:hypothetical protein
LGSEFQKSFRECRIRLGSRLIMSKRQEAVLPAVLYIPAFSFAGTPSGHRQNCKWEIYLMQYALIIRESAEDFERRADPTYKNGWVAYTQALIQAGIMTGGAGLTAPETATVVRRQGEDHEVKDGPFPDGKEQLGGFYLIDVPDLDAALEWALRIPISQQGSVEIRPRLQM